MKHTITIVLIAVGFPAQAQLSVGLDYLYVNATSWDDAVRTYNAARPWSNDPMPLLTHAGHASAGWLVKLSGKKSIYARPAIGFSRLRSHAAPTGSERTLRLHAWSLSCDLNVSPRALFQNVSTGPIGARFFVFLSPSVSVWRAKLETQEGEWARDDAEGSWAPQTLNWGVDAGFGYRALLLAGQIAVTPVLRGSWYPSLSLDGLPVAVAGADGHTLPEKNTHAWMIRAGLEFTWIVPRRS